MCPVCPVPACSSAARAAARRDVPRRVEAAAAVPPLSILVPRAPVASRGATAAAAAAAAATARAREASHVRPRRFGRGVRRAGQARLRRSGGRVTGARQPVHERLVAVHVRLCRGGAIRVVYGCRGLGHAPSVLNVGRRTHTLARHPAHPR
eukprot:CAMPEP_0119480320 /NCGR_PEP_ID=MMETSP1344-20130328/9182_1 /TAXON_ID=236787 /ORGANISM="Florenciella parvula, Strain CCMP2471" /LENGTH=150 /DNA_ID=CAMNT_0007514617 /DNA_START=113 /DNA_END=562 /DNA_ORIENTATION=-